ncbi:hypothetical protein [Arenibacter latericius]|uniref:hypothetical protein n=1 Tax=Arenibacter latericius TaxID=86104 RepID=UPI0004160259|nr:hypothetical protein [Arenibacter latericius]
MKKLSLKNLKLNSNDLLQREQLRSVFGGYGGGSCTLHCVDGTELSVTSCKGGDARESCKDYGGPDRCSGDATTCDV